MRRSGDTALAQEFDAMIHPLLTAWFLLLPVDVPAQTPLPYRPAPLYSLPRDGTWVEYAWHGVSRAGQPQKGKLCIRSVGRQEFKHKAHRWIEITLDMKQGDKTLWKARKFLLAESACASRGTFAEEVALCYGQEGRDGPVTPISANGVETLLNLGLARDCTAVKEVASFEEVSTGLGVLPTRHIVASGWYGRRQFEYHCWLTREVPFGWARFEIRELSSGPSGRVLFSATVVKTGQGARSEVSEGKAR
jgi:hypothetical protein